MIEDNYKRQESRQHEQAGPDRAIIITLKKPRIPFEDERIIADRIQEFIKNLPEVLDVRFLKQWDTGIDVWVKIDKFGKEDDTTIKLVCRR